MESVNQITNYAIHLFPQCSSVFQAQLFATKLDQVMAKSKINICITDAYKIPILILISKFLFFI